MATLNTPTILVRRPLVASVAHGEGELWPIEIPLPDDPEESPQYALVDIGVAMLIRVTRWQAVVSITKTEDLTRTSDGVNWSWTETATGTISLPEKTTTATGVTFSDEKIFAQALNGTSIGNACLKVSSESFPYTNGAITGTKTGGVGAGAFTGTWDANNANSIGFFNSDHIEVFGPAFGDTLRTALLGFNTQLAKVFYTETSGSFPPAAEVGFVIDTAWNTLVGGVELTSDCTVRIPSCLGGGNVEVTTSFGESAGSPPAGHVRNSRTIAGSVVLTPIASLGYSGTWNTSTGARLLNPLTVPLV